MKLEYVAAAEDKGDGSEDVEPDGSGFTPAFRIGNKVGDDEDKAANRGNQ